MVDNAKSGTCYMCMNGMYALERVFPFFSPKIQFFRLDPTYCSIKQVLLETWAPNCEIIPMKCLFFKSQKVTATGYYDIEKYQT